MKICLPAANWALGMIALATAARFDWVDRDAAMTILLVMPLIGFTAIMARRGAGCAPKEA